MELGRAQLRWSGFNSLQNALHPQHGLIWTDGKRVYLVPIHLYRDQVENARSICLGEFEYVQSVHWSYPVDGDTYFMAAVYRKTVSVWHVSGAIPQLAFKQVRKINVQPIPQGCLWNPKSDILCLLSGQQCSFYFQHMHKKGSFAFPSLEHEKIHCGCWMPDGKRLVLCVGTVLLINTWTDLESCITDFVTTTWKIAGPSSSMTAIEPASTDILVCATDIHLQTSYNNISDSDTFFLPGDKSTPLQKDDVLEESDLASVKGSLPSLQGNEKAQIECSAMLSVVQLKSGCQDPIILTSTRLPGILAPDILHFQVRNQSLVVGSNTENTLHIFALLDNHLLPAGRVVVGKDQRPKGICSLHSEPVKGAHGVLVLLGTTKQNGTCFPSTHNTASFDLSLKFFPTRPEKLKQLRNVPGTMKNSSSSSLTRSESMCEPATINKSESFHHTRQASYKGERPDRCLQLPGGGSISNARMRLMVADVDSGEAHNRLLEEISDTPQSLVEEEEIVGRQCSQPGDLETEAGDFSSSTSVFHNSRVSQSDVISSQNTVVDTSINLCKLDLVSIQKQNHNIASTSRVVEQNSSRTSQIETACSVEKYKNGLDPSSERLQTSVIVKDTAVSPLPTGTTENGGKLADVNGRFSLCSSSLNSNESNYETLERQIEVQRGQIDVLQKRLAELRMMIEQTTCVLPAKYQKITEPETVNIQCVVKGARVSRRFLLDNGRLQLEAVKQALGLLTVELILDGEPLVLGTNVDGYIPIKFTAGSFLRVTGIPITYSSQFMQKQNNKETAKS